MDSTLEQILFDFYQAAIKVAKLEQENQQLREKLAALECEQQANPEDTGTSKPCAGGGK